MSIDQKFPELVPWSIQPCPLCGEDKIMVSHGIAVHPENSRKVQIYPDRGYSFCNCKSIWFTQWSNIESSSFKEIDTNTTDDKLMQSVLQHYIHTEKIFNKGYKKNRFLDLGSISSFLLDEAKRLGWETTGWDKWKRKKFKHSLIVGDFETKKTKKKFDLIWASHIFEHFHYPIKAVKKCYDLLNPDGIMFVAMPDPYFIVFAEPYNWGHWLLRSHHIMWDMDSFCDELEKVGFKVLLKDRNLKVRPVKDYHIICQK